MKTTLITILIYIIWGFILVWDIIIPYGVKIITHIEGVVNNDDILSLSYCFKQLLIGIILSTILSGITQLILFYIIKKT